MLDRKSEEPNTKIQEEIMRELKTMLGNLENHDVEMNGFNSS
jgi:hypothetical protein